MWTVLEHKTLGKSLKKAPKDVLEKYQAWKRIVELSGLQGLRAVRGFRDESLKGRLKGKRSSRLGKQWRVIYASEKNGTFIVYVFEVHPHKY